MFQRICKITFISHGATIYSLNGIINDDLKSPKLNTNGKEETERVCSFLKKRGVVYDKIYTSPYVYCTETAQIIAKTFDKKSTIINLLGRNHGEWQGQTFEDIFKESNDIGVFAKTPKNGDSIKTFNKKVITLIDKIVQENKGNRIIIVTKPEIIQSVLANVLNLEPECQNKMLIKTGTLTQVSYFKNWASVIYSNYEPF